jgi:hypothetical protein
MDKQDLGPQKLTSIFTQLPQAKKPPAYKWQDLALRIITELGVPNFKRASVFKVCKENSEELVLKALNDTKELCKVGIKWQYFFKVISSPQTKTPDN